MVPPPPPPPPSATTIGSLPPEILTEVLLGVATPAALIHAAAVSTTWRDAIVTAPNFLSRYRKRHRSSPFLGLYVPRELAGPPSFQVPDSIRFADGGDDAAHDPDLKAAVLKASDYGVIRRYQDHRLGGGDAFIDGRLGIHRDCRLLGCHNGRLLLTRGDEALEVRSPLARESVLLPFPPDAHPDCLEACLLQDPEAAAAAFRVVYLQHRRNGRDRQIRAVEYDSSRKTWQHHPWKTLKISIEGRPGKVMQAGHRMFCIYSGRTQAAVMLDIRNMEFSFLPLPTDANFAIGEIEDNVCCLVESTGIANHRLIVRHLDETKLDWELKKDIKMDQVFGGEHVGYYSPCVISNGIALLCSTNTHHHCVVDLNTCSMTEKFEFYGESAYLMQMPWPPTFSAPTANAAGGFDRDGGPASVGDARTGSGESDTIEGLFGGTLAMAPAVEPEEPLLRAWGSQSPFHLLSLNHDLLLQPLALAKCPHQGRKQAVSRESKGSPEAKGLGRRNWKRKPKFLEAIFALRRRPSFSITSKISDEIQIATSICREASAESTAAATAALQEEMKALVASIPDGAGAAFTAMQLQELEQQSQVYQYMAARVPVPTHLVFPVWKSLTGASSLKAPRSTLL